MSQKIQAIRGMNDVLPTEVAGRRYIEQTVAHILESYGYQEIRLPLVEKTALFSRAIGEVTDIVEKEMYTFLDRNGDSLSLRPEGTAGCVRACIENGLLHNQKQRLWYNGPMFRHEKPQKGRYRQFNQIGVEVFGFAGPEIDAEVILASAALIRALNLNDVVLKINSLGQPEARLRYRDTLTTYLEGRRDELDEDSLRRLNTNPLRILDSKNPDMQNVIAAAPLLTDSLDDSSREHFERLLSYLEAAGQPYVIDPRLVRGLDYYNRTVFEWVTTSLGSQGTVCAGGRYDGLVEQIGGRATPAIGFALGLERILALMIEEGFAPAPRPPQAYLIALGDEGLREAIRCSERLRRALPGLSLTFHGEPASLKAQFKKADLSGAKIALIIGDDEASTGRVSIKYLRDERPQIQIESSKLVDFLTAANHETG